MAHLTFSDKINIVGDRMIRDADARGDLHAFIYIGASGETHEVRDLLLSTALGYCRRFAANGKICGVDYIAPRQR